MIKLRKVLIWALVLFIVYLILELIRKILGGSLGFEEIMIALLVTNVGYSFNMNSNLSEHLGWHRGKDNRRKK